MLLTGHIYECKNTGTGIWELRYFSHFNINCRPIFVMYRDHLSKRGYGGYFAEYKYIGMSQII